MKDIVIREPQTASDHARLILLFEAYDFSKYYKADPGTVISTFSDFISSGYMRAYIAFDGKDAVGFALCGVNKLQKEIVLQDLFVLESYRWTGIAKSLLARVYDLMKEAGYSHGCFRNAPDMSPDVLAKMAGGVATMRYEYIWRAKP